MILVNRVGRTMGKTIGGLIAMALLGGGAAMAASNDTSEDMQIDLLGKENPLRMRMVEQSFSVVYASAQDAAQAKIAPAPVLGDKKWAFTSRWDDCRPGCARMEALLSKYGYGGTFYLNSSERNDSSRRDYGPEWARGLVRNNCTIGGHTLSHPMMPKLTYNEMFYEALAIKIEREAQTDDPINAFAFPYGRYYNEDLRDDDAPRIAIAQALARSGYHMVTYNGFIDEKHGVGPGVFSCHWRLQPGDHLSPCEVFDKKLAELEGNEWRRQQHPAISLGVHVGHSDEGFANLEKSLKKHQGRKDWWYTNETTYGAYRYLSRHARVEEVSRNGAEATYRLTRPVSADLGERVALTLVVTGARVASTGGEAASPTVLDDRTLIDIAPPDSERYPEKIDWVRNPDNAPQPPQNAALADFPGVLFFLSHNVAEGKLRLHAHNRSSQALRDIAVVFRLPLAYATGLCRRQMADLAPGAQANLILDLPPARSESAYREGRPFFVAQAEFDMGETTGWVYASARGAAAKPERPAVRDAARIAGPVAPDDIDLEALAALSRPDKPLAAAAGLGPWQTARGPSTADETGGEYVDLGAAPGDWLAQTRKFLAQHKGGYYALALDFDCDGAGAADIVMACPGRAKPGGIALNGALVAGGKKLEGLRQGRNRLIALLPARGGGSPRFDRRNFVRITPDRCAITYVVADKASK